MDREIEGLPPDKMYNFRMPVKKTLNFNKNKGKKVIRMALNFSSEKEPENCEIPSKL